MLSARIIRRLDGMGSTLTEIFSEKIKAQYSFLLKHEIVYPNSS
jgi:hypothetical protein